MLDERTLRCPCCERVSVSDRLVQDVNRVIDFLSWVHGDIIEEVVSGSRCWNHHVNIYKKIPGDIKPPKNSYHLIELEDGTKKECEAVDIRFTVRHTIIDPLHIGYLIQHHLNALGVTQLFGLGVMNTTIHLDVRDPMKRKSWIRKDGKYLWDRDFQQVLKMEREDAAKKRI
jgi:hypothetical protein